MTPSDKLPKRLLELEAKCQEVDFTMPSDRLTGSLLRTLVSAKRGGRFLEIGTGIGLSLAWMVDGMHIDGRITTIDNDPELSAIAEQYFGDDSRIEVICIEGGEWIQQNRSSKFDVIFADAWPGKYNHLDEILDMLAPGGFYVIDDMKEQPTWPEGHAKKASDLMDYLHSRGDLSLTYIDWSTGVAVASKVQ